MIDFLISLSDILCIVFDGIGAVVKGFAIGLLNEPVLLITIIAIIAGGVLLRRITNKH